MTPARTDQNAGDIEDIQNINNGQDIAPHGRRNGYACGGIEPAGHEHARGQSAVRELSRRRSRPGTAYRAVSALGALALGFGGALAIPMTASAAPAPCEQAERYAAQSGAELFHLNKLDAGKTDSDDVAVGEAKSALVAQATVNAAAVTRVLDADGQPTLSKPVVQQAPPTSSKAAARALPEGTAGPLDVGRGTLTSRAKWDPRMACGSASGDVTRAEVAMAGMGIGELVRVPKKASSLSTTALAPGARTVASAGLTLRGIDLLDGAVRIKVVRQPALTARMSTKDGGKARYTPPVVEVSGENIKTRRLEAVGDVVEFALSDDDGDADGRADSDAAPSAEGAGSPATQSSEAHSATTSGPDSGPAAGAKPEAAAAGPRTDAATGTNRKAGDEAWSESDAAPAPRRDAAAGTKPKSGSASAPNTDAVTRTGGAGAPSGQEAGAATTSDGHSSEDPDGAAPQPRVEPASVGGLDGLLSGLPKLGGLTGGSPLPLPTVSGVPPVGGSAESAPVTGPGTRLRVSLGDLRQATSGRAIAAKAIAIKIAITQGPTDGEDGYGGSGPDRRGVVLDLDVGLLEAVAVAPAPAGGVRGAVATGGAGGLPITGPATGAIAVGGVTLLLAGIAALTVGLRKRRFRP